MKALIVVRLSRLQESSTSVERQEEICRDFCKQKGWEVAGVATDTDVSGSVDPFDRKKRPELAGWLAGEREPFDALVVYRADRLTRSVRNLQTLVAYAEDHGFVIASATEPHFDLTSPFAAVLVALIGMISEWELTAITERNRSTAQRNIRLGKYRGSTPPWGFRPSDESGEWRLVQDPEQVTVIREVVRRVLDGEPLFAVADDLTARGVPTVKDIARKRLKKPVKGTAWSSTVLKRSLISDAMLGLVVSDGVALRGADGAVIERSEPILSREELERVRHALSARAPSTPRAKGELSLMTGVLKCGVCGEPAYRFGSGVGAARHTRYRCRSIAQGKGQSCGNRTIRTDQVDGVVEGFLLAVLGPTERKEKVWQAGSDASVELSDIDAELVELTGLIGSPAYRTGSPQRAALDTRIEGLVARQEQLQAQVVRPAGFVWQGTGEKFGPWWESLDTAGRNAWLRSMGATFTFDRERAEFFAGDLVKLLEGVVPPKRLAKLLAEGATEVRFTEDGIAVDYAPGEDPVLAPKRGK
jgi:site-specific DNA recombinase